MPDSSRLGTLLCDLVFTERQVPVDLVIRWSDNEAQHFSALHGPSFQPGSLLSTSFGPKIQSVCDELHTKASAIATLFTPDRQQIRFRLRAIDKGYVALLEWIDEKPPTEKFDEFSQSTTPVAELVSPSGLIVDLLDSLPGGVVVWKPVPDRTGNVIDFQLVLVNQVMSVITNRDAKSLVGQLLSVLLLNPVHTDFFDRLLAVVKENKTITYEYPYKRDAKIIWLAASLIPVSGHVLLHCQDISQNKQIESDIARRLELESIISSISSRLINLSASELDCCILDALAQIGQYSKADQIQVFMCSVDLEYMDCLYEWCGPAIPSRQAQLQHQRVAQFAWWHKMKRTQQVVNLRSSADLPTDAAEEKADMARQGMRSTLRIPLVFDGDSRGLISFNTLRETCSWEEQDIMLLKTFAEIIVNALKRQQNEAAVKRAYQRLQGLHTIDKALLKGSLTDEIPAVTALRHLNDLIPCERLLVFRFDTTTDLAFAEGRLINGIVEVRPDIAVPINIFRTKWLLAGQPVNISEITPDTTWIPSFLNLYDRGFRSMSVIPLLNQGQMIGAFVLLALTTSFFNDEYLQIAQEVADQLSVALYQQQLREQVRQNTGLLEQRVEERTVEIHKLSVLQNAILKNAGLAIVSSDATGLIQTVNPATEKLLGYTADELVGKVYPVLLTDPSNPDASTRLLDFPSTRFPGDYPNRFNLDPDELDSYSIECSLISKDRRHIPALLATSTLRDETGTIIGYIGLATDITALKAARTELQQKNQELETFFSGSLDLHAIADTGGRFLKLNRTWETTFGYTMTELLGRAFVDLVHSDDRDETSAAIVRIVDRQPGKRMLNRVRKKDGDYCMIEWTAVVYENLIYASARDITEQREAEAQLRNLNQRLQLATRAARQGIWELDLKQNTLFWDERQHEIHGTTPATFNGAFDEFLALVHPDDRAKFILGNTSPPENPESITAEKRIILPGGQIRHVEAHSQVVYDPDGLPSKLVGVSWDITDRKQTELNLRESEERYRSLVNNLKDIVFQKDLAGNWTFLNPAWEDITGYTIDEALGQPFYFLIDPELHPLAKQLFQDLIDGNKESFQVEIPYRHKTGDHRWADVIARVMLDNNGNPIGTTGTIADITERKKTLDALRDSEERFRDFADIVDDVFWIHSANPFRLLYVNPVFERIWGYSCQRFYTDESTFLAPILVEDRPAVVAALTNYRNGGDGSVQYRLQVKGEQLKWFSVRTFVMKDADGVPVRYIGIASDITSLKEKELVLQQSLQREQELNKLKSQFVSTASHEFRTPLSTILSSVDLIKHYVERPDSSANSSVKRHLRIIEKEIENLSELLSDMLTIGRIDAGKVAFRPRITDLLVLAEEIVDTHFQDRPDSRDVEISVDGPPYPVYIDDKLITHVLVNMLSNAFKFSKENPALRLVFQEHQFCIVVIDQGIGIPADEQLHLFESFFRARNAISIPGSGLGLVIARQFIELHGGTIRVQSQENQGTQFTVTIPLHTHTEIVEHESSGILLG